MFLSSSLSCQPSSMKVLADRGAKPLTNNQICDLIASKVAQFKLSRDYALFNNRTTWQVYLLQTESCTSSSSSVVRLPQASSYKELKQSCNLHPSVVGSVTVGLSPAEERWRTVKSPSEYERKEDSRNLSEVNTTSGKDEQRAVVATPIERINCSPSQKENTSWLLDGKTFADKPRDIKVCQPRKDDAKKETVSANSRSGTTRSKSSPLFGKTQVDSRSSLGLYQDNLSKMFLQTKHNNPAQGNTDRKQMFPILRDPQYDNISDVEEPSGWTTRFLRVEQYEDISEDDNQYSREWVEERGSTPPVLSDACSKTSENNYPKDKMTAIHSSCCIKVDSSHHLCSKGDHGGQTNYFGNEVKSLSDEEESEDEWEVIPVRILDLKFESVDKLSTSEAVVHCDVEHEHKVHHVSISPPRWNSPCALKPIPASAFSEMAVFDTPDDQEQAVKFGHLSFVVPSSGRKSSRKDLCSERLDRSDTDSSTYSSGHECNYMTVAKEQFKGHCVPENGEDVQMPILEKFQSSISPDDGIINLLDSEEEDDNPCRLKSKKHYQDTENCEPGFAQHMSSLESRDSESEDCVLVENEVSKQNKDSVVIILTDSDDEERDSFNPAKNSFTEDFATCSNAGSRQEGNVDTSEVARSHSSIHTNKNKKSSRPRGGDGTSIEALRRGVVSSESEDGDGFRNEGGKVPQKKKFKTAFGIQSEVDSTSNEVGTLAQKPRHPRSDLRETMAVAKSSLKERLPLIIKAQSGKPASITSSITLDRINSSGRLMQPSQFTSSEKPSSFPQSSVSMQATTRARNKVFSDWKRQHVPLRREKKNKGTRSFRCRR